MARRVSSLISPSRYSSASLSRCARTSSRLRPAGVGHVVLARVAERRADPVQPHLEQLAVDAGRVLVDLARLGQLSRRARPASVTLARAEASARWRRSPWARPRARSSGASVRPWPTSVATTTTAARKTSVGRSVNGRPVQRRRHAEHDGQRDGPAHAAPADDQPLPPRVADERGVRAGQEPGQRGHQQLPAQPDRDHHGHDRRRTRRPAWPPGAGRAGGRRATAAPARAARTAPTPAGRSASARTSCRPPARPAGSGPRPGCRGTPR